MKLEIEGNLVDSFHTAFKSPMPLDATLSTLRENLSSRLIGLNSQKGKCFAVYCIITEIGDSDAISQREESENEERILRKRQA